MGGCLTSDKVFFIAFEDLIGFLIKKGGDIKVFQDTIDDLERWRESWYETRNIEGS